MTVGRNKRRREAFVEEANAAINALSPKGDQHQIFLVEGLGDGELAVGYHDLLRRMARLATKLERGQTLTISLPPTRTQRFLRNSLRSELGLTGAEFLDPKMVPHDA